MSSVYRARNSLKVFILIFLAFSLFFSIGAWRGIAVGTNTWMDLVIGAVLVCVGAVFATQIFTACVVITNDSISYRASFVVRPCNWTISAIGVNTRSIKTARKVASMSTTLN